VQQGAGLQQQRGVSGLLRTHQCRLQQRGQHAQAQRAEVMPPLKHGHVWHQTTHLENAQRSKTVTGMK
jgi:hypothetical protein